MDASVNPAEVPEARERLLGYARALDIELGERDITALLSAAGSLGECLERLRRQLAAAFGGDFLAYRLWQGLQATPDRFLPPAMARQPFPSALFGRIAWRDTD